MMSFDLEMRTAKPCQSAGIDDGLITIYRSHNLGPTVAYHPTLNGDLDAPVILLDVWDRASFMAAYRHARIWRGGGLGHRIRAGG